MARAGILLIALVGFSAGCTPLIGSQDINATLSTDGEAVLTGAPFEFEVGVTVAEAAENRPYSIALLDVSSSGTPETLWSIVREGSASEAVELSFAEHGDKQLEVEIWNTDAEGDRRGDKPVASAVAEVTVLDSEQTVVQLSNSPSIWLVDEPFEPSIEISSNLETVDARLAIEVDREGKWTNLSSTALRDYKTVRVDFDEEGRLKFRASLVSGPRTLATSETLEFDVFTAEGMVQDFFYLEGQVASNGTGEEILDWVTSRNYPGIFQPSIQDEKDLIARWDGGQYIPSQPFVESVRENQDFFPGTADNFDCIKFPEEWPPVPGRHFTLDYEEYFQYSINGSPAGEDTRRGTRHLTFFEGQSYFWLLAC